MLQGRGAELRNEIDTMRHDAAQIVLGFSVSLWKSMNIVDSVIRTNCYENSTFIVPKGGTKNQNIYND